MYAQEGSIWEIKEDLVRSKNAFNKGIKEAQKYERKDDEIRCLTGLSRVLMKLGNESEARKKIELANKIKARTPVMFL